MKFPLISYCPTTLLFFSILSLLVACGGENATKEKSPETRASEIPEVPHEKCSVVVTGENAGVTYKIISESNYTGDIKFNCSYNEKKATAQKYFLVNGVPSLNIVQLKRDTKITSYCTLNNSPFTDTLNVSFNYKTGVVATRRNNSAKARSSCKSKYKSPLDTTITSHESIFGLLEGWGVDVSEANKAKTGLTETNCPQTVVTNNKPKEEAPVCKTTINNQYTITDDTGKVHTLEREVSF